MADAPVNIGRHGPLIPPNRKTDRGEGPRGTEAPDEIERTTRSSRRAQAFTKLDPSCCSASSTPPPKLNRAGTDHTFTTSILRHTDHQPLANYRVRYRILDGPPGLFLQSQGPEAVVVSDLRGNANLTLAQAAPAPYAALGHAPATNLARNDAVPVERLVLVDAR